MTDKRTRVMYLRDEDNNPKGAMVAIQIDDNTLRFGMARYHPTKERLPFTKEKCKEIAFDRALKCQFRIPPKEGTQTGSDRRLHDIPRRFKKHALWFMQNALERLDARMFNNVISSDRNVPRRSN